MEHNKHLCTLDFSDGRAVCGKDGCENRLVLRMFNQNLHGIARYHLVQSELSREKEALFEHNRLLLRVVTEGLEVPTEELFK